MHKDLDSLSFKIQKYDFWPVENWWNNCNYYKTRSKSKKQNENETELWIEKDGKRNNVQD